jgi:hypothetical protein
MILNKNILFLNIIENWFLIENRSVLYSRLQSIMILNRLPITSILLSPACIGKKYKKPGENSKSINTPPPLFFCYHFSGLPRETDCKKWFLLFSYQNWDCRLCSDDFIRQKLHIVKILRIPRVIIVLARIAGFDTRQNLDSPFGQPSC